MGPEKRSVIMRTITWTKRDEIAWELMKIRDPSVTVADKDAEECYERADTFLAAGESKREVTE